MTTFKVYDWAGNELSRFGIFSDFEDAWGAIRETVPDEDEWQDYYVLEIPQ